MAAESQRSWKDREGTEWEIVYNPSVELDTRRDRSFRERILFRSGAHEYHAPAAFGSDLDALSDGDLQGLLDQAREEQDGERSAWASALDREAGEE